MELYFLNCRTSALYSIRAPDFFGRAQVIVTVIQLTRFSKAGDAVQFQYKTDLSLALLCQIIKPLD